MRKIEDGQLLAKDLSMNRSNNATRAEYLPLTKVTVFTCLAGCLSMMWHYNLLIGNGPTLCRLHRVRMYCCVEVFNEGGPSGRDDHLFKLVQF